MDRTVTVTGHGSSVAVPDSAVVRVAATHRAASVAEAFAGVASAVEGIASQARRFTEPARIASRGFQVWPAHDHQGRQSGFEARHSVEIRCPDLAAASGCLEALVEEVGDRLQVEGVTLEVSDSATHREAAREAAYADAQARATQLAGLAGTSLGAVVAMVEGGGGPVFRGEAVALRSVQADMAFEPGEQQVGCSLTVTWELAGRG